MYESKCKSCLNDTASKGSLTQEQIDDAVLKLAKNKKIKLVSDDVYEFRLLQCRACKYLEYGTTCLKCGCYVQIRARLSGVGCPLSKEDRWNPAK